MSTYRLLGCALILSVAGFGACSNDAKSTSQSSRSSKSERGDTGSAGSSAQPNKTSDERDGGSDNSAKVDSKTKDTKPKDSDQKKKQPNNADEDASTGTEKHERLQDGRSFKVDEAALGFEALPNADAWSGTLGKAGYRIEVPKDWNGVLVMYAHGYAGTGEVLNVTIPSIRQYLIDNGYAWAASSYSTNFYDVRAGVEDTNELALEFSKLAADHGRKLDEPRKRYIIGHSMGGHVAGAAVERETKEHAVHKVDYAGAVPMCGVMGDTELFNFFTAFQWAAEKLAGIPNTVGPVSDPAALRMQLQAAMFKTYPSELSDAGLKLRDVVRNLTGGKRSNFDQGFAAKQWQDALWSTIGGDGTINGILAKPVTDTHDIVYQFDDNAAVSGEERAFNDEVYRSTADADANGLRSDGLRWIPKVNGEFDVPVVTLHTLGDLYVPFKMEQIYHQRAEAKGSGKKLAQRAIRGTGHCEFTIAEQISTFKAMVRWEEQDLPAGSDNVIDAYETTSAAYGCNYTENTFTDDERSRGLPETRMAVQPCLF